MGSELTRREKKKGNKINHKNNKLNDVNDEDTNDEEFIEEDNNENIINDSTNVELDKKEKSILNSGYNILMFTFEITYKSIKIFISVSGIYLIWIFLHYFASHLYVRLCVPKSLYGFVVSPFLTATPHCQGLRWIIYNGANTINNMWVIIGTWICSNVYFLNKSSPTNII